MVYILSDFGELISKRLCEIAITSPSIEIVSEICRTIYAASLITEEGRFLRGSVTLADPLALERPPRIKRADYPAITAFKQSFILTPDILAKLARAVDQSSGSLAVWGTSERDIVVWGVVDQMVGTNTHLNWEEESGFVYPGLLTLIIDRPGDITAFHGRIFLGALRAQKLIRHESEPFKSTTIRANLKPTLAPISVAITNTLKAQTKVALDADRMLNHLMDDWHSAIARICIGLRRLRTGGALIITPNPLLNILTIGGNLNYERLAESMTLNLLDSWYLAALEDNLFENKTEALDRSDVLEVFFAQADAKDRADELRGSIKLVTSLAAKDGAILLSPDLKLVGFGVKINAIADPEALFEGDDFEDLGPKASQIDLSRFGTRHSSMLRYCRADANAIGVVVSQDGHVRVIATYQGNLVMWDNIQLLRNQNFNQESLNRAVKRNKRVSTQHVPELGYSRMPKTLADLMNNHMTADN